MARRLKNGRYNKTLTRKKLKCPIPGCGRNTDQLVPDPRFEGRSPAEQKFCCNSCRKRLKRRITNDTQVYA